MTEFVTTIDDESPSGYSLRPYPPEGTPASDASQGVRSLFRLGEYRAPSAVDIEGGNLIATGLDMTTAAKLNITLQHSSASTFQSSGSVFATYSDFVLDLVQLRGLANGSAHLPLESGFVQMRVMNFTTGDFRWEDSNQGAQFIAASTWSVAPESPPPPVSTNLADTALGSFNTESPPQFVQHRVGARIKEITFTFRDRRSEQTARFTAITIPANAFSGGSGWTLRFDNSFRYGISQNFTLGGVAYTVLVQWAPLPTGYAFWFMDAHSNVWNTYGRYENVLIKWEAA